MADDDEPSQAEQARERAAYRQKRAVKPPPSAFAPGGRKDTEAAGLAGPIARFLVPQNLTEAGLTLAMSPVASKVLPLAYRAGAAGLGYLLDPDSAEARGTGPLWHGISQIRLPRPIAEMMPSYRNVQPVPEKIITPSDLQGSRLVPVLGDRSMINATLTGVSEGKIPGGVPLQGGHGYMAVQSPEGAVWASAPGAATSLVRRAEAASKGGKYPVQGVFTSMGERSVDASHHVSDALAKLSQDAPIASQNMGAFNTIMREKLFRGEFEPVKDWPGGLSRDLVDYLRTAPGEVRNKYAKLMDTGMFQEYGFPSVAEVRHAVTDPRLLDQPLGAAGLSIARLDPAAGTFTGGAKHFTYPSKVAGEYTGGFGTSVPAEVMFPDIMRAHAKNYPTTRPDYLLMRGAEPYVQPANQQWVDRVSKWLEQNAPYQSQY